MGHWFWCVCDSSATLHSGPGRTSPFLVSRLGNGPCVKGCPCWNWFPFDRPCEQHQRGYPQKTHIVICSELMGYSPAAPINRDVGMLRFANKNSAHTYSPSPHIPATLCSHQSAHVGACESPLLKDPRDMSDSATRQL